MISVKGGGGENVRPETDEYTALLAEAITEMEGKAALGGDATAEDIREGKTAYVNGQLLEGLMKEGPKYGMFFNEVDSGGNPTDIKIVMDNIPERFCHLATSSSAHLTTLFNYAKKLEIVADEIGMKAFGYATLTSSTVTKLKVKAKTLGQSVFANWSGATFKAWISKECTSIDAPGVAYGLFAGGKSGSAIYCESTSKPSGWGTYWDYRTTSATHTVTWGVTEEQFNAL